MMNSTSPRRKKLTLDERAALLQTGEEYRIADQHMKIMAGSWFLVLLVLLALLTSQVTTTARAHMVYTGFGWERPVLVVKNLNRVTQRTAYVARRIAPQGWAGAYARTASQCIQQPKCSSVYGKSWLWWWNALPDTKNTRIAIEWLVGALIIMTPSAVVSVVDVMGWQQWERRYTAQQRRAEQRRRRGVQR